MQSDNPINTTASDMLQQEESYINGMLERTALFYDRSTLEKVRNTVVAIAGLGGVGAITAELLARWGIKTFRLLDKDKYEPSNLNRQLFATSKTIGRYKVDVTAERIKEINPYVRIEMGIKDRVDNENVHRFVDGAGIIIQTADSPSCVLFYRVARQYKVPIVNAYSTIIGCRVQLYDYRISSWWYTLESLKDKIKWRGQKDVTKMTREELDDFDKRVMHPAMPTMNFVTNIAGAMIVGETIKLLTNTGRLSRFPGFSEVDLYRNTIRSRSLFTLLQTDALRRIFFPIHSKKHYQSFINKMKIRMGQK